MVVSAFLVAALLSAPTPGGEPGESAGPNAAADSVTGRFGETPREQFIVRIYFEDSAQLGELVDYDLLEFTDRKEKYVRAIVDDAELAGLAERGFRVEIDPELTAKLNAPRTRLPGQVTGIPGFPCYRTVEETFQTAEQIVADHPELATWIDAGDSWEKTAGLGGYDLWVLRLTRAEVIGPKPKLLVTSSIHAREYTPAELNMRFAEYLVDHYGIDADATWLLDHHEIHLMLHANPDGRKQAETGRSWRKNTNRNYCGPTSVDRGADLNRNFEFEWGCCGGSSGSECSETYRGPSPGSEPETQTIESYLLAQFPDQRGDPLDAPAPADATGIYIDLHSSGRLLLWPWGFGGTAPNDGALQTFGRKLAYFNGYEPEQGFDLYPTDGTTMDFAYGELGVASFVYEFGTFFFQDCSTFEDSILPDNLASLLYAAKVARTPYLTPPGPDALEVEVAPAMAQPGTPTFVTATIDDTRYENGNGTEPSQIIAAAEYYIDRPPWDTAANPVAHPMEAADGDFDEAVEPVTAQLNLAGLTDGRHILFVRGRDADGNQGAFSAAFFYVTDGPGGLVRGRVLAGDTGAPLSGTVSVDSVGLSVGTDPETGDYALPLPVGEWTLRAAARGRFNRLVENVPVVEDGTTLRDFALDPAPSILVVDDDDDDPDVRGHYTAALDALGASYFVWDTGNGDDEPTRAELAPFEQVVWFSGDAVGGAAGPGPAAESGLATWLDSGRCLWVSGQDFYADRGLTGLMETYLGVHAVAEDVGHVSVVGLGPAFGGLGPFAMDYPYANRSDRILPRTPAKVAFHGSEGDAAVDKDGGSYRTTYLGFGLETISAAADRQATMDGFLGWCATLPLVDGDGDGLANGSDCSPSDPDSWAAPTPARDLIVTGDPEANLTWTAPSAPGAVAAVYDLLRADDPAEFWDAACVESGTAATTVPDPEEPSPGAVLYYLVRSRNACAEHLGADSSGARRFGPFCF